VVSAEYGDLSSIFVLLSPEGVSASGVEDAEFYVPISYSGVFDLIQHVVDFRSSTVSIPVIESLRQYLEVLRRHVLGDSKIQDLAQQIYERHRRAMDLIIESKPDLQQEIRQAIESVAAKYGQLEPDYSLKSYVRYYDPRWDEIPKSLEGEGWTE
jgi:hypothetical protein